MPYQLRATRRALRGLRKLPPQITRRIRDRIDDLADAPRPPGCRKLKGDIGYRIRVGDYRVIYDVDDDARTVTVLHVGHRRDIYRGL